MFWHACSHQPPLRHWLAAAAPQHWQPATRGSSLLIVGQPCASARASQGAHRVRKIVVTPRPPRSGGGAEAALGTLVRRAPPSNGTCAWTRNERCANPTVAGHSGEVLRQAVLLVRRGRKGDGAGCRAVPPPHTGSIRRRHRLGREPRLSLRCAICWQQPLTCHFVRGWPYPTPLCQPPQS